MALLEQPGAEIGDERRRVAALAMLRRRVDGPDPDETFRRMERNLESRFGSEGTGFWLWEDGGQPVSLAGFGGPTPTGIRIGPVYTPPEHRRRGYATTLVADLSSWLLGHGHRACFLYTDLANPTSNRIYVEIGYQRVCDAMEFSFRVA